MRETTFEILKGEVSRAKLEDPPKLRWTTGELEGIVKRYTDCIGPALQPGTLHVRVHRAIQQAKVQGILRPVSRGMYEVTEAWGPGHMVGMAVSRALRSVANGKLRASNKGLGIDGKKKSAVLAAVLTKGGPSTAADPRMAYGLARIGEFLRDHPGVVVVYSLRVKGSTGPKSKAGLVWPY